MDGISFIYLKLERCHISDGGNMNLYIKKRKKIEWLPTCSWETPTDFHSAGPTVPSHTSHFHKHTANNQMIQNIKSKNNYLWQVLFIILRLKATPSNLGG